MSNYDPLDVRGLERVKEEQDLKARVNRDSEESDLKWLLGSKRGRRIVHRLLEQSGVFKLSFNTNAMQMAFAEGNRNFGNRTLAMINTLCPELYSVMIKEANDVRNIDDGSAHRNSN